MTVKRDTVLTCPGLLSVRSVSGGILAVGRPQGQSHSFLLDQTSFLERGTQTTDSKPISQTVKCSEYIRVGGWGGLGRAEEATLGSLAEEIAEPRPH